MGQMPHVSKLLGHAN